MSSEPLFKRRRLNENARILAKPFVSPLKSSKPYQSPLRQNDNALNLPYQPSVLAHTITAAAVQSAARGASGKEVHSPAKSTPIRKHPDPKPAANADEVAAQRAVTALELQIRAIRNEIDTLTQAAQLSSSSTDTKLKDLAHKWKCASQAAAEEVFETVKMRVDHMGGVAAWRRSETLKYERHSSWDNPEQDAKVGDPKCEFDSEGEELAEEEKEQRKEAKRTMVEKMRRDAQMVSDRVEAREREEDCSEQPEEAHSLTMGMMLRSLNIELDVIGFDKETETWIT